MRTLTPAGPGGGGGGWWSEKRLSWTGDSGTVEMGGKGREDGV